MKPTLLLLITFVFTIEAQSQILKKIGKDLGNDAKWKVRSKANQKMDQVLDSITAPKKNAGNDKNSQDNNQQTKNSDKQDQTSKETASISTSSKNNSEEMNVSDGYITLFATAEEVFKNGTVVINGKSLKYGNFNSVKLVIEGPGGNETETLPLDDYNNYSAPFGPDVSGDYILTAFSSNGKVKETVKIKVLELELTNWDPGEEEVKEAEVKLKEEADKVEQSLGEKDKEELEKK